MEPHFTESLKISHQGESYYSIIALNTHSVVSAMNFDDEVRVTGHIGGGLDVHNYIGDGNGLI